MLSSRVQLWTFLRSCAMLAIAIMPLSTLAYAVTGKVRVMEPKTYGQTAGVFKESGNSFKGNPGRVFVVSRGGGDWEISGFDASKNDFLRIQGFGFTSPDSVRSLMTQDGHDVLVHFPDGSTVRLADTALDSIPDSCFQLELDRSKLTQSFGDDFDKFSWDSQGASPSKVRRGTWRTNYGWGPPTAEASRSLTNEQQVYTDPAFRGTVEAPFRITPFHINQGILEIWGEKAPETMLPAIWGRKYTSGLITTKGSFSQLYGVFEIRAKLPKGRGYFPAFWLLPVDSSWPPELDVFEMLGHETTVLYSTTHTLATGEHTTVTNAAQTPDLSADFHDYAVAWSKTDIRWYFDGVEIGRTPTPADMNKPMYLLANLAIGSSWPGSPDSSTVFPGIFAIDWIRAYRVRNPANS